MTSTLFEITEELGNFIESFESFMTGIFNGSNTLFVGLFVVALIGLITYFIMEIYKVSSK